LLKFFPMEFWMALLLCSVTAVVAAQETITIKRSTYSIAVDKSMRIDTAGTSMADFIAFFPLQSETDKFGENLNVVMEPTNGVDVTLEEYVRMSLEQLKQYFGDIAIVENKTVSTTKGQPYHKLVYTASMNGFLLQFEQRYISTADYTYVLTFTAEQSQFNAYKEKAGKILGSFKLH